jgi:starvation-inducible DNA-binding protein
LLSDFQLYYQNLREINWDVREKRLFDLHVRFEELYTGSEFKKDRIPKRVFKDTKNNFNAFDDYKTTTN